MKSFDYSNKHKWMHKRTHSDGMFYSPISCAVIGVKVLIYVLCFNINITLAPTESIMKHVSVRMDVRIRFYCTSEDLIISFLKTLVWR